jgi:hypothetical protein
MAVTLTINGNDYSFPQAGEAPGWGAAVTNWATAVTQGMLQKAGGAFTLTAEVDFGATYGLKSEYYKSRAFAVATSGVVRFGNDEYLSWRDAANSTDLALGVNSSDVLEFDGNPIVTLSLGTAEHVLKMNSGGTAYEWAAITDANIDASAAIAYSKLDLVDSLVDADINSAAAIAYSKLNLAGSIVDADINTSAAIAYSKLATLTADRVLSTNNSGVITVLDTTTYPSLTELSYVKGVTSAIQTQIGSKVTKTGDALSGTFTGTPTFSGDVTFSSTGAITLPSGTSAQQPGSPVNGMIRYNSDSTSFEGYAGGAWGSIGGASGGINYAEGSASAESGVGNWAAYADAAGTTPVDGSGGSPNITITRSTSSPLRGTAQFLVTKDAANRQGEGVSLPFTIDSADTNTVLSLKFDYNGGVSANYIADDLKVFIYDVTNATLIYPQGDCGLKATKTGFATTFVTTNSVSYRLIVHNTSSSNTTAYTFAFDNVYIGPQELTYGVPMEDWTSFTPVVYEGTNNKSADFTTLTGFYKRSGDTIDIWCNLLKNGSGGSGSGQFGVGLPSGLTAGAGATRHPGAFVYSSAGSPVDNQLSGSIGEGTSTIGAIDLGVGGVSFSTLATANQNIILKASLPIAQWANSSVWLSSAKAEYVSHDGTNIVYGPAGAALETDTPAGTNEQYTITSGFSSIQPTDKFAVQVQYPGSNVWIDAPDATIDALSNDGSNYVGIGVWHNGTDVILIRGKYRSGGSKTWATAAAGYRVRVVKYPGVIQSAQPNAIKWQTKYLLADSAATSGVLSNLAFNNLVIGKTYRYTFHALIDHSGTVDSRYNAQLINSDSLGTNILTYLQGGESNGGSKPNELSATGIFVATDSNLNYQVVGNPSGNTTLRGDATLPETYLTLEELPYHVQTTEWT